MFFLLHVIFKGWIFFESISRGYQKGHFQGGFGVCLEMVSVGMGPRFLETIFGVWLMFEKVVLGLQGIRLEYLRFSGLMMI